VGGIAHRVIWAVPHPFTLTVILGGFEAEVYMGRMPLLLPNEQCQSYNCHSASCQLADMAVMM